MTPATESAVLFEAVSTPPRSFDPRGFRLLAVLLTVPALAAGLLFLRLGAWPVVPLVGAEVAAVLALIRLHHHRSGRAVEVVLLTERRLTVTRTGADGRRERVELDPYWTRLDVREPRFGGGPPELWLTQRGRGLVEVGRFLAGEERRDFAAALREALRRYREPVFDNPQLREAVEERRPDPDQRFPAA